MHPRHCTSELYEERESTLRVYIGQLCVVRFFSSFFSAPQSSTPVILIALLYMHSHHVISTPSTYSLLGKLTRISNIINWNRCDLSSMEEIFANYHQLTMLNSRRVPDHCMSTCVCRCAFAWIQPWAQSLLVWSVSSDLNWNKSSDHPSASDDMLLRAS
jgi:hypothetical protein